MTAELLQEHLRYEPESGNFFWIKKTSPMSNNLVGSEAGWLNAEGYNETCLLEPHTRTII